MRRLSPNVLASTATAALLIATSLVSVPLILDRVGLAGYGVWTLGVTILLYVTIAEAGIGPSVQRFAAVAHGGGDLAGVGRLLWSSLALYTVAGAAFAGLCVLAAPGLVDLFDVPARLREDAEGMFRVIGVAVAVALLAAPFGNVQQGLERFTAFGVSAAVASAVYLAAIVVALTADEGLRGLAWAAVAQQLTLLAVRAVDVRKVLAGHTRGLLRGAELRGVLGFAARLQMTVLSIIVNTQTDKVVVGLVASPATLGQLGIGTQVAEAGRLVAGAGLSPIVSRLSAVRGAGRQLEGLFDRLNRLWMLGIVGGTAIGAATTYPLIAGWLGDGHGEAALLGTFLVVAYGLNLLSGPGVAYLRAVGRPSLEARYGAVLIGANVVLSVVLGIAFGARGVVVATTLAYALGTAWFFANLRRAAPELAGRRLAPPASALLPALIAAALAAAFGVAMVELLPAGVALVPIGLGTAAAFVAYLSATTGVRPTPRALRAAVGA